MRVLLVERDRCLHESTAGGERLVKSAGGEMDWRNLESSAGGEIVETRRVLPLKSSEQPGAVQVERDQEAKPLRAVLSSHESLRPSQRRTD